MLEFTDSAAANIAALPPKGARAQLVADAKRLKAAVVAKESPREVARQARSVAAALLNAYPVPLAPARSPDLARGATLYRSEEHTSELQSLMRISYAVFCLKKTTNTKHQK